MMRVGAVVKSGDGVMMSIEKPRTMVEVWENWAVGLAFLYIDP